MRLLVQTPKGLQDFIDRAWLAWERPAISGPEPEPVQLASSGRWSEDDGEDGHAQEVISTPPSGLKVAFAPEPRAEKASSSSGTSVRSCDPREDVPRSSLSFFSQHTQNRLRSLVDKALGDSRGHDEVLPSSQLFCAVLRLTLASFLRLDSLIDIIYMR